MSENVIAQATVDGTNYVCVLDWYENPFAAIPALSIIETEDGAWVDEYGDLTVNLPDPPLEVLNGKAIIVNADLCNDDVADAVLHKIATNRKPYAYGYANGQLATLEPSITAVIASKR